MHERQVMTARGWKAPVGMIAISVLLVVTAMNVRAQTPVAGTHVVTARPVTVDTRISVADVLDRDRVTFVMALGGDGIREITTEAELQVARNELLVARLREPAIRQITEGGQLLYVLPYRFKVVKPGTPNRLNLRAVAVVEQGGLRVDPQTVRYRGSVRVGIEDEDNPGAPPVNLANPVLFQLIFSAGSVSPTDLKVTHTNFPFKRVELGMMQAPDKAMLNIRASFDPTGEDLEIPLIPLDILSAPEAIPGLGFGFGDVSVQLPGFLVGKITEVTLSTNRGFLRPIHVPLSKTGHGQSVLRSAFLGAGVTRINVERSDLIFAPVTVRFFWPWMLILAVVAGAGVSGGLFARTKTNGGFLRGFPIGFVSGVAICAGINLTSLPTPQFVTTAVGFVFAAIPGFVVAWKIRKAS